MARSTDRFFAIVLASLLTFASILAVAHIPAAPAPVVLPLASLA